MVLSSKLNIIYLSCKSNVATVGASQKWKPYLKLEPSVYPIKINFIIKIKIQHVGLLQAYRTVATVGAMEKWATDLKSVVSIYPYGHFTVTQNQEFTKTRVYCRNTVIRNKDTKNGQQIQTTGPYFIGIIFIPQ